MLTTIINLAMPIDDENRMIAIDGYQAESYSESPSSPNFDSVDIQGRSSPLVYYTGGSARTISFSMYFHRDLIIPTDYGDTYWDNNRNKKYNKQNEGNSYDRWLRRLNERRSANGADEFQLPDPIKRVGGIYRGEFVQKNEKIISSPAGPEELAYYQANPDEKMTKETREFNKLMNFLRALNYPVYGPHGITPPQVYLKIGGTSVDNGTNKIDGGLRLKGYCSTTFDFDGLVDTRSLISATVNFNFTEVIDQAWSAPEVIEGMHRYKYWMERELR